MKYCNQCGAEVTGKIPAGDNRLRYVCVSCEEIDMQNRKFFLEAGGEKFSYIPALNDRPAHISALANIIQKYT